MAQTTLNVRMDEQVKKEFDAFCAQVGFNASVAVNMFVRAVLREHRIPFEIKSPVSAPLSYDALSKEQFDIEIKKGIDDFNAGRTYSADEIEEEMKCDYGV